jgi:hypothetical protein
LFERGLKTQSTDGVQARIGRLEKAFGADDAA